METNLLSHFPLSNADKATGGRFGGAGIPSGEGGKEKGSGSAQRGTAKGGNGLKKQQKEQQVKSQAEPCTPSKAPHTVKITNYGVALSSLPARLVCAKQHFHFCLLYSLGPVRELCQDIPTLKDVHENPSENVQVEFREG